jgi:hypothetical protein
MCTSSTKAPAPPPKVPEAARTPEAPSAAGGEAPASADARRKRKAAGQSTRSTILTSSRGTQEYGETAQKTLLGS